MRMKIYCLGLFLSILFVSAGCNSTNSNLEERPLFKKVYKKKKEHSDKKAIKMVLEMIDSSGGYKTWKNSRYLSWVFLGMRSWIWDKKTGDVRMHSLNNNYTVLMNLNTKKGKVYKDSQLVTNPDTIQKYLERGYKLWANDSYWVFMPFKLFDPGVRLQYKGTGTTITEEKADIIRVTFDSVGVTPQNMYDVYIDKESRRVRQWDYYPKKGVKPMSFPWTNYRNYNGLKIALNRGGDYKISQVSVRDSINRKVFETYNPYDSVEQKQGNKPPA